MKPTMTHRLTSTQKGAESRESSSRRDLSQHARPGLPMYLRGGHALPEPTSTRLEGGFGQPVAHIRVHEDAQAAHLNDSLDAEAFTLGSHVFLGAGQSPSRLDLLAHEVAHALQQLGAPPAGPLRASRPGDADE